MGGMAKALVDELSIESTSHDHDALAKLRQCGPL